MSPPLTRRRVLAGLGSAVGLGTAGSVAYHAYTGPVNLYVHSWDSEEVELSVQFVRRDGSVAHDETYTIPPLSERDEARAIEDRVADDVTRGTTFTVEASTEAYTLHPEEDTTFTVTCTGYVGGREGPLTDEVILSIPRKPRETGMYVDWSYCGSLYDPE